MNTDKIFAEGIVNEYSPKDTSRVVALKKLDRKAKLPSEIFAYGFGIGMSLIAGTGMCLSMEQIGAGIPALRIVGIGIGLVGFAGMGITYPVYKKLREAGKKKYAFEIMELAKEIADGRSK